MKVDASHNTCTARRLAQLAARVLQSRWLPPHAHGKRAVHVRMRIYLRSHGEPADAPKSSRGYSRQGAIVPM